MDLANIVILSNITISIGCLAIAMWMISIRRQIVAWRNWCDRWNNDRERASDASPSSGLPSLATIAVTRSQIHHLRQIYQQQQATLDRVRSIAVLVGLARSGLLRRR